MFIIISVQPEYLDIELFFVVSISVFFCIFSNVLLIFGTTSLSVSNLPSLSRFFVPVLLLSIKRLDRKLDLQLAAGPVPSVRAGSWQRRSFTRQLWPPSTLLITVTFSSEGQRFLAKVAIHLQGSSEQLRSCCCWRRWRRWRRWWWDQRGCKRSQRSPPPYPPLASPPPPPPPPGAGRTISLASDTSCPAIITPPN